jgi:hypothetical protein
MRKTLYQLKILHISLIFPKIAHKNHPKSPKKTHGSNWPSMWTAPGTLVAYSLIPIGLSSSSGGSIRKTVASTIVAFDSVENSSLKAQQIRVESERKNYGGDLLKCC